eukprot:3936845-Rhodomonas_salina.1
MAVRTHYGVCGTEIGYDAMWCAVLRSAMRCAVLRWGGVVSIHYGICGTETGYGGTHSLRGVWYEIGYDAMVLR